MEDGCVLWWVHCEAGQVWDGASPCLFSQRPILQPTPCHGHLALGGEGKLGRKSKIVLSILNISRKILEAGVPLLYYYFFRSED